MKRGWLILMAAVVAMFLSSGSSAAPAAKDEIIPLIAMDDVPLTDAIRTLARKARLNILLDPRLSAPPFDRTTVTIRWERVTAKEALIALLENYGLVIVDLPRPLSVPHESQKRPQ